MNSSAIPQTPLAYRTLAPEPGPKWMEAKRYWGFVWELHWIGLGLAYALLACRSLWAIIGRNPDVTSLARRPLFHAINWLLVAVGITRSLYLFIDPYESAQHAFHCPLWIIRPLFGIAFPSLMSAFCLVHIAFLEATDLQIKFSKLRSFRFVVSMIFVHFAVVIVSDTTSALKADKRELLVVCQTFFIVWGLLNSACFIYSGSRVIKKTYTARKKICPKESVEEFIQRTRQINGIYGLQEARLHDHKETEARKTDTKEGGAYTIYQVGLGNHLRMENENQKALKQDLKPHSARNRTMLPTNRERAIHKVAGITLVTSFLSITCCALQIYGLFGVYSVLYSEIVSPQPWPWFSFQTSFRLVELFMAYTLSYCVNRSCFADIKKGFARLFRFKKRKRGRIPRIISVQKNEIAQRDLQNGKR